MLIWCDVGVGFSFDIISQSLATNSLSHNFSVDDENKSQEKLKVTSLRKETLNQTSEAGLFLCFWCPKVPRV